MLSKDLLEVLCCPKCHGDLLYEVEKKRLTCKKCGEIYQIKDNIPIMMIDDDSMKGGEDEQSD